MKLIAADQFEGCRDSLRDYLMARVMGPQQYGYVQTLRAWLDGGIGTPKGLLDLSEKDQTKAIATALNELLGANEKTFKSSRGQDGQTGTLRTKRRRSESCEPPP